MNQDYESAARLRDKVRKIERIGDVVQEGLTTEKSLIDELSRLLDQIAFQYDVEEPLALIIDPGTAKPEEIGELLHEISNLYRMVGGSGLTFRATEIRCGSAVS